MGKKTKIRAARREDDKIITTASPRSVSLTSLAGSSYVHVAFITLLVIITYSNTLGVPFQWDDAGYIAKNPFVRDIGYFVSPSEAHALRANNSFLYSFFVLRYVGFLTFALNYGINGFSVAGYHIFNIALHISNSILVYLLVLLTFRTPFFEAASSLKQSFRYIALVSSMLFAVHPLQTEAVTYVFQRFVPLATFFYLLSLTTYIGSRLTTDRGQRLSYYGLSLLSAVLAMKTKEIAFTLPIVISLYEFLFFRSTTKRRALLISPLLLSMSIIPLTMMYLTRTMNTGTDPLPGYVSSVFSRTEYMLTEFRVIVTYLRLLFIPMGQNIDYDYPVFRSFFDAQVLLSFLFLVALFFLGAYLAKGKGPKVDGISPDLRLVGFGILWFFIALSVESSVIPLTRLIDEYRVYLPSVGVSFAIVTGVLLMYRRWVQSAKARKIALASLILVVGALAITTYQRNGVWGDDLGLWADTARKSPMRALVHQNLGFRYQTHGMVDKAIDEYLIAIKLDPGYAEPHNNLGFAYETLGVFDKALEHYLIAIRLNPSLAEPHFSLGHLYYRMGQTENARKETMVGLGIEPDDKLAQQLLNQIIGNR